jgi:hypothetical protein
MHRAYAFDVREVASQTLIGVGLLVPDRPSLSFLTHDGQLIEPALSGDTTGELKAWVSAGDALLPRRPAPMSAALLASVLSSHAIGNEARRFAAIPVANLGPFETRRVLAGILSERQTQL